MYQNSNYPLKSLILDDIWVNYNKSLAWIKAIKGDDFPNPNYDFQGSLVVSSL